MPKQTRFIGKEALTSSFNLTCHKNSEKNFIAPKVREHNLHTAVSGRTKARDVSTRETRKTLVKTSIRGKLCSEKEAGQMLKADPFYDDTKLDTISQSMNQSYSMDQIFFLFRKLRMLNQFYSHFFLYNVSYHIRLTRKNMFIQIQKTASIDSMISYDFHCIICVSFIDILS